MGDNNFILDSFVWSYSRVNCYEQCPQAFKMIYIDCLDKDNNAFAQWGTLGHSLLERYYNGNLDFFELSQHYEEEYNNVVTTSFPPNAYVNLNHTYYEAGKDYFDNFEGDFEGYEVLGIEQEFEFHIGDYKFMGFIDLILKNDNGIVIVDHKSKSKFKSKKEKKEYLRQLYLYSIYIYETYGEYPTQLMFNMFRVGNKVVEDFDIEAFEDAKKWCIETIKKIYKDTEFNTKHDDFFCNWLCSTKHHCVCSDKYLGEG